MSDIVEWLEAEDRVDSECSLIEARRHGEAAEEIKPGKAPFGCGRLRCAFQSVLRRVQHGHG